MITVATLRAVVGLDDSQLSAGLKRVQSGTDAAQNTLKQYTQAVSGAEAASQKAAASIGAVGGAASAAAAEEQLLAAAGKKAAASQEEVAAAARSAAAAETLLAAAGRTAAGSAQESASQFKGFTSELQTLAGFAQQTGIALTVGLTAPILAVGFASVQSAVKFDALEHGLQAVTHDAGETERQLRSLTELAKLPGVGLEGALRGSLNLQAAGFSAAQAEKSLRAFSNALVTVGKGVNDLDRVNLALTELAAETTGYGRQIRMLQIELPQLRQIMLKVFGTAQSEEIAKMGISGKQFVALISDEFAKLDKVENTAKNTFENFGISLQKAGAEFGKTGFTVLIPLFQTMGSTVEYAAHIWGMLPGPIQAANIATLATVAAAGPLILIMGTLAGAVLNGVAAWKAYVIIKEGMAAGLTVSQAALKTETATLAANETALAADTAAVEVNAAAKTNLAAVTGSLIAKGLLLGLSLQAGYTIGTALNDLFVKMAESGYKNAQAIDDETTAHEKSIPHLQMAIQLRKQLADVDAIVAARGDNSLKESPYYKDLQKRANEEAEAYAKAQEMIKKGFDKTEADAATNFEKMRKDLKKETERMQEELNKLQAPDIMARLRLDYPGLKDAELENARRIEESVKSEKELKKIFEDQVEVLKKRADDIKRVKDEIEKARISLDALKSGSIVEKTRATLPLHTPDSLVRQLAAINQEKETFEKARVAREQENKAVLDLTKKIQGLGLTTKTAGDGIQDLGALFKSMPGYWKKDLATVQTSVTSSGTGMALGLNRDPRGKLGIPILPPGSGIPSDASGAALAYTKSLSATRPTIMAVVDAQKDLAEQSKFVREVMVGIGIEGAGKLIEGLISASREYAVLTSKAERDKIAIGETGKAYKDLSAAAKILVDRQVELHNKTILANDLKKVADAWNDQRIALLRVAATTDDQRAALDLLKKSYATLSPLEQQRIHEMTQGAAAVKRLSDAQEQAKTTSDGIKTSFEESRTALLQASASTEKQRVELRLWSAYLKDVPGQITDAGKALEYLRATQQSQAAGIDKAADSIVNFDAKAKLLLDIKGIFAGDFLGLGKMIEDANKATDEFDRDISKRLTAANLRIKSSQTDDTAEAAWLKFLASNNSIANALAISTGKAADAAKRFKEAWAAEQKATGLDKERKAVEDFEGDISRRVTAAQDRIQNGGKATADSAWLTFLNHNNELLKAFADGSADAAKEFEKFKQAFTLEHRADEIENARKMLDGLNVKIRENTEGLAEGEKKVVDYNSVLTLLGITASEATGGLGELVQSIVEANKKLAQVEKYKKIFSDITGQMKTIFENAFGELATHGFKGFFDSIVGGFQQMLQKMAADFLASQLTKLIGNLFSSLLGGLGGGGGGILGGLQAGEGGLIPMAATGATASAGMPYIVGERGPELFIPSNNGRISPNGSGGGMGAVTYAPTYYISTPDANSFRKSESQITQDGARTLQRISRRNGD